MIHLYTLECCSWSFFIKFMVLTLNNWRTKLLKLTSYCEPYLQWIFYCATFKQCILYLDDLHSKKSFMLTFNGGKMKLTTVHSREEVMFEQESTLSATSCTLIGSQSRLSRKPYREQDSCWSWVVCFCSAISNIIVIGFSYSYGILFPVLLAYFKQDRATTGNWYINNMYLWFICQWWLFNKLFSFMILIEWCQNTLELKY